MDFTSLATQAAAPDRAADASVLGPVLAAAESVHSALDELMRAWLQMAEWGGLTSVTGMSAGEWAQLSPRLPKWLTSQLESIVDRLPALPLCGELFFEKVLTFEDLAGIVRVTAELNGERLTAMDEWAATKARLLASAGRGCDLLFAVEAEVQRQRAPGWAQRQEARAARGQEVSFQQDFDGGGLMISSLDAVGYPTMVNAVMAKAGKPSKTKSRKLQRAEALVAIAAESLDGRTEGGKRIPSRPSMTVVVDLDTATSDRFADLMRVGPVASAPTLSAKITETLAAYADVVLQLVKDGTPLARIDTLDIPQWVRDAVQVRDKGCRFPGCNAPVAQTDIHHIVPRRDGGPHHPNNLVLLCRRHHGAVDRIGWDLKFDPKSGTLTFIDPTLDLTFASRPHGQRHVALWPDTEPLPEWLAPPIPEPPADPPPRDEAPPTPPPPDDPPPDGDPAVDPAARARAGPPHDPPPRPEPPPDSGPT